jgi:flagellin
MDGVSFIQTTEGYLNGTTEALQRIRELAVQGANGIYSDEDRMMLQLETHQMVEEVDRVASHAQFNGLNMLTGRFAEDLSQDAASVVSGGRPQVWLHVGANMDQRIRLTVGTMTAKGLGIINPTTGEVVSLSTPDKANMTIGFVDEALKKVNMERAKLGAFQNRLEKAYDTINIASENTQAAESRIRDHDMAKGMVDYTKNTILIQAANAMVAQANQKSQSVLQLLR